MKIKCELFATLKGSNCPGARGAAPYTSPMGDRKVAMSYSDKLRAYKANPFECGLGKVLETDGQEKYDEIVEAIFLIDEDPTSRGYGRPFSLQRLVDEFRDEYGWGEYFFRRHRNGRCTACVNRDKRTQND